MLGWMQLHDAPVQDRAEGEEVSSNLDDEDETQKSDHSASLGDSVTSSTQIRFSVHAGELNRFAPSALD